MFQQNLEQTAFWKRTLEFLKVSDYSGLISSWQTKTQKQQALGSKGLASMAIAWFLCSNRHAIQIHH